MGLVPIEDRASNGVVLDSGYEGKQKMGHEEKPKHQTRNKGQEFKSTASQRLSTVNEDDKLKSKVQGQKAMTTACTEDHNDVKLSNRFAVLDI